MDYLSISVCKKIASIDAKELSTQPTKYIEGNSFQYYVAINSWLGIIRQHSEPGCILVADAIRTEGFIDCIKRAQHDADIIISESLKSYEILGASCPFVAMLVPHSIHNDYVDTGMWIDEILEILRYPKRFSPLYADKLESGAFADLLAVNNSIKMHDRKGYSTYLCNYVRPFVHELCAYYTFKPEYGYFSSGAVNDSAKSIAEKFSAWKDPYFLHPMYPLSGDKGKQNVFDVYNGNNSDEYYSEANAVPKSYKAPRIIAKEPAYRQWMLQAIRYGLEESVTFSRYSHCYRSDKQEQNRFLAYHASVYHRLATVDLSHASDSISTALARDLFPKAVSRDFDRYRSYFIKVNGKMHPCYMLATSGAANCFTQESIIFLGIALAATNFVRIFYTYDSESLIDYDVDGYCHLIMDPSVYGDDCIVDVRVYPTFCEFLIELGFTVNTDKSFSDGGYRESCGVEFFYGNETTSFYFPRKPVTESPAGMQSLIELHNVMWKKYPYASTFVKRVVTEYCRRNRYYVSETCDSSYIDLGNVSDFLSYKNKGDRYSADPYKCSDSWDTETGTHGVPYLQHMVFDSRPVKKTKSSDAKIRDLDMFYYVTYLVQGPQYDDPLLELLRVSSSRRSSDHYYSATEVVIRGDKGKYEK